MNELSERMVAKYGDETLRVLVVDDSRESREGTRRCLQDERFEVLTACDGSEALQIVDELGMPSLVILDHSPPKNDGLEVAAQLKKQADVPIIVASSVFDAETIAMSLNYFAEDFVIKPFSPAELAVRVKRLLLCTAPALPSDPEVAVDNHLRFNFAQQYAVVHGQLVLLTPTENRIIQALYNHRGRVLAPSFLLVNAWDARNHGTMESLWVHIRRLRRKIEPDPNNPTYIMTVRGRGYCLPINDQRGRQVKNENRLPEMAHA